MRYFISDTLIIDFDKVSLVQIEKNVPSSIWGDMHRLGIKIHILGVANPYIFYNQAADVVLEAYKKHIEFREI